MSRLRAWWRSVWCSHEDMRRFESGRVFLVCSKCGRETSGWTVHQPVERPGLH